MRIVVAISGASGVVVGGRLLKSLKDHHTYVIVSDAAKKIAVLEGVDIAEINALAENIYREDDIAADIGSSSYIIDAMVVVPCSMKTLSSIASGFSGNLISRCAENILKMNRKLVVVPRDTPLSLAAIENMAKLKTAGAVILPPNMAYYYKPETVDNVTDFFVGKVLDCLGLDHKLYVRWDGG